MNISASGCCPFAKLSSLSARYWSDGHGLTEILQRNTEVDRGCEPRVCGVDGLVVELDLVALLRTVAHNGLRVSLLQRHALVYARTALALFLVEHAAHVVLERLQAYAVHLCDCESRTPLLQLTVSTQPQCSNR